MSYTVASENVSRGLPQKGRPTLNMAGIIPRSPRLSRKEERKNSDNHNQSSALLSLLPHAPKWEQTHRTWLLTIPFLHHELCTLNCEPHETLLSFTCLSSGIWSQLGGK